MSNQKYSKNESELDYKYLCITCKRQQGKVRRMYPQDINPEFVCGILVMCDWCVSKMPIDYFRLVDIASEFTSAYTPEHRKVLVRADVVPALAEEIAERILVYKTDRPSYVEVAEILAQICQPANGGEWTAAKLYYTLNKPQKEIDKSRESAHAEEVRQKQKKEALYNLNQIDIHESLRAKMTDEQIRAMVIPDKNKITPVETIQDKPIAFLQQMPGWEPSNDTQERPAIVSVPVADVDKLAKALEDWKEEI